MSPIVVMPDPTGPATEPFPGAPRIGRVDPRELLDAEREQTEERLARLREDFAGVVDATRDANSDDEHDPEGHTIAYERSQTGALVRQAEQHLVEIDAALVRLDGTCERCGQPIAAGRLEARPTARTCVTCAARSTP
jgi:DnaK suppressor protein